MDEISQPPKPTSSVHWWFAVGGVVVLVLLVVTGLSGQFLGARLVGDDSVLPSGEPETFEGQEASTIAEAVPDSAVAEAEPLSEDVIAQLPEVVAEPEPSPTTSAEPADVTEITALDTPIPMMVNLPALPESAPATSESTPTPTPTPVSAEVGSIELEVKPPVNVAGVNFTSASARRVLSGEILGLRLEVFGDPKPKIVCEDYYLNGRRLTAADFAPGKAPALIHNSCL